MEARRKRSKVLTCQQGADQELFLFGCLLVAAVVQTFAFSGLWALMNGLQSGFSPRRSGIGRIAAGPVPLRRRKRKANNSLRKILTISRTDEQIMGMRSHVDLYESASTAHATVNVVQNLSNSGKSMRFVRVAQVIQEQIDVKLSLVIGLFDTDVIVL